MNLNYSETIEFQRDFKRLLKKFQSLDVDFERSRRSVIEVFHIGKINNNSIFQIQGFGTEKIKIFKLKKFACKYLKSFGVRSGIRIIYAYNCEENTVTFIQIYFKGQEENENRQRIEDYLSSL